MTDWLDDLRAAARAALPPLDGELVAPGLHEPVEVLRDAWGVPYLSAGSLEDLWFAQGFVTASERLFQIDLVLRAANGRLSELFSDLTVDQDRFARVIGFHRIGALEAERWSDTSRSMLERFVAGVRAWVSAMPAPPVEYALLAVPPELPTELGPWAAAFAYAAWGLSGNWDVELLRSHLAHRFGSAAVQDLLPPAPSDPPSLQAGGLAGRLLDALRPAPGQGSNSWVVDGRRTTTGKPLLANDPHLLVQQPGAWFEVHLRVPGYEARGVAFPFAPGILVGVTPHHAWGITNVSGDVQDVYEERLNEDGTAAELDGAWERLTVRSETIAVRGGDALTFDVRETRHGPLLEAETVGLEPVDYAPLGGTYALRWTATEGLLDPAALVDVATASDFEGFRAALRGVSCPGQNVVYADVDGTIGYQLTGRYPIRRAGDGSAPVPGWTTEHEWEGWVPFEDLPWSMDPERGAIVTANNRTFDVDYPHLIGRDFHTSFRARRIAERLTDVLDVEEMAAIQVDVRSLAALELLPHLTALQGRDEHERWALGLLSGWDGEMGADSTGAALYGAWLSRIAWRLLQAAEDRGAYDRYFAWREWLACRALAPMLARDPAPWTGVERWPDLLLDALADALALLGDRLGPDRASWRWGALHTVRFAHPLARMPGFAPLFLAAEHELGGDEQTVLQASFDARDGFRPAVVPSWRLVADLADVDRSSAVLPTGQSGNPASPHWNDQADLWIEGRLRPAPVTRPAVEAAAQHRLALVPDR